MWCESQGEKKYYFFWLSQFWSVDPMQSFLLSLLLLKMRFLVDYSSCPVDQIPSSCLQSFQRSHYFAHLQYLCTIVRDDKEFIDIWLPDDVCTYIHMWPNFFGYCSIARNYKDRCANVIEIFHFDLLVTIPTLVSDVDAFIYHCRNEFCSLVLCLLRLTILDYHLTLLVDDQFSCN